jgi:redox-sensitive bicupin YhaK (pirin superfamily)
MITLRPSKERGHFEHGWLDTYHTFSFDKYHDPNHMGFRTLRVINEDRIAPGRGFGMHPHKDMEILTYVLEGELNHQDSMGHGSTIKPNEVQRMTAGTGVTHSEFNHSQKDPVHLLQIWILPEKRNLTPGYEQRAFPVQEKHNRLRLVASPDFAEGSVKIHQDVRVYSCLLDADDVVEHLLGEERHAWVQVASGAIDVSGMPLNTGDGAAISYEEVVRITGKAERSEFLLFDLA